MLVAVRIWSGREDGAIVAAAEGDDEVGALW